LGGVPHKKPIHHDKLKAIVTYANRAATSLQDLATASTSGKRVSRLAAGQGLRTALKPITKGMEAAGLKGSFDAQRHTAPCRK
jgi:hypothetical protein